jgi:hypothetical protein
LVELLFREQYFNGNDMLRIKKHMVCMNVFYLKFISLSLLYNLIFFFILKKEKTCVYLKKIIEFCGMRCSVRQMWAPNGDIVTCGYISEKTRVCLINLYKY